jgi:hypothetical protein
VCDVSNDGRSFWWISLRRGERITQSWAVLRVEDHACAPREGFFSVFRYQLCADALRLLWYKVVPLLTRYATCGRECLYEECSTREAQRCLLRGFERGLFLSCDACELGQREACLCWIESCSSRRWTRIAGI